MWFDSTSRWRESSPGSQYQSGGRDLIARARNAAHTYVHNPRNHVSWYKFKPLLSWQRAKSYLRASFCVANLLAVRWMFTLWWGERLVFQEQIARCRWESWEKWVSTVQAKGVPKCEERKAVAFSIQLLLRRFADFIRALYGRRVKAGAD